MQDVPLTVSWILRHGGTVHGRLGRVTTWAGEDAARRSTFADVAANAARLAGGLRELGVTGDQRVGTFMWNNVEHLEAYLGVPSMGAVLHTLNIRLFAEQLLYTVNHAEDRVLIVDSSLLPVLLAHLPGMETVEHVVVVGDGDETGGRQCGKNFHRYADLLSGRSDTFTWPDVDERSAAALCYTTGTTGKPKGVAYSHRSIVLHSLGAASGDGIGFGPADQVLMVVPMFHANAWGLPLASFLVGASMLMPDRFLQPEPLVRMIGTEGPTLAGAVPSIWGDVLLYLDSHPGCDVSSLRKVVVGGSTCPPALIRGFRERYAIEVLHAWGMTEMSPLGTTATIPAGLSEADEWGYRTSQGRFGSLVDGRIVAPDGSVAPWDAHTVGELEVRGPWIAGSYYRQGDPDPAEGEGPAERFHNGWLRTGDIGAIDPDGYLVLTDRAKDVIKSGGEWISSVALENVLIEHPAVAEACVIGVPDAKWGERPLAAVVLIPGQRATPEQLHDFMKDRVASWQLPERWAFIDEVPKTSVGKFDKKTLRKRYADDNIAVAVLT